MNDSGKRPFHRYKEFQYKHGQRLHPYDNDKAPYPLSYDKYILELESLDNRLAQYLRGSVSFVTFEERPKRALDLGCGTGIWVIDAAKEWTDCELIGFDLVDIQISQELLPPSIAHRIQWRHGNFLTTRLPFDDDEFDHVHIQSIAKGVPENKEVSRVLRPGGSVEVIEDDAVFPCLPRWFTTALRSPPPKAQAVYLPDGSRAQNDSHLSPSSLDTPPHDHALLESLYKSVFEQRFINLKPSAVLPSYLTTYFRHVILGPVVNFPMPPLAPLRPLPPEITTYIVEPGSEPQDAHPSTIQLPLYQPAHRPSSLSFSSSMSSATNITSSKASALGSRPRTTSAPLSYRGENKFSACGKFPLTGTPLTDCTTESRELFILDKSATESDDNAPPQSLIPVERLASLSERSLAMHLYRSYQSVLACEEAMWEELKDRIRNRRNELLRFGWDDDEELEEPKSRTKFERLVDRYRSDMKARISLWCSLDSLGWPLPSREPLSKAELIEEMRLREDMIEAQKYATVEELQIPCRAVRVVLGYKM
ncbi:S-adenosyl-L-methionine-dependent methyltransferase [Phlegmacium glaucopus]|nr:S-adenosyl-L-methionine-dependent methyltransferase [Phlegmacium glaucopus]